ncbi:hypothetical protein [Methanobrevibacter sp. DSM 116169]|uniref:hypothetical protein n=1 Tax=Methanobrevibacter sp. DSM 116169 TaxID=3242727 RepID=UPI0038FC5073
MSKNFLEIMRSPSTSLNSKELKIQTIMIFILCLIGSAITAFLISFRYPGAFLPFFLGVSLAAFFPFSLIFTWDFLKKHFNMDSRFEAEIILWSIISLGLSIELSILGYFSNNFIQGLGFGFVLFYPFMVMFFRKDKCFNEKSEIISNEKVFGYSIRHYWVLGSICGLCTIGYGFFCLSSFFFNGVPPIVISFLLIFFSLIVVYLVLCPDLMNKILPFEIRRKNGFYKYSALCIGFSFILLIILTILIGMFFW